MVSIVFEITVKSAHKVPGKECIHVMGIDVKGSACVGDKITDGNEQFNIVSLPFMHRSTDSFFDGIDMFIDAANPDTLVGKTLRRIRVESIY